MNLTTPALASVLAGSLALASALPASADRGTTDWARVTHVEPVTVSRTVRTPVETCREVAVRNHHRGDLNRRHHRDDEFRPVAALIGGVIGGAIGNQFGGGNGKRALTAAGALLGASIANEAANDRYHTPRHGKRVYCETSWDVEQVNEVIGYDVTYRYRGHSFTRRMDEHPGKRVPVTVDVRPAWEDDGYATTSVAYNHRRTGYQM